MCENTFHYIKQKVCYTFHNLLSLLHTKYHSITVYPILKNKIVMIANKVFYESQGYCNCIAVCIIFICNIAYNHTDFFGGEQLNDFVAGVRI